MLSWRCPVSRWREPVAGVGMEQENLCLDTDGQSKWVEVASPGGERETRKWQKPRVAEYRCEVQGRAGS